MFIAHIGLYFPGNPEQQSPPIGPGIRHPTPGYRMPGIQPPPPIPTNPGVPGYPIQPRPVLAQGLPTEGPPGVTPVNTQQPQPGTGQPAAMGQLPGFLGYQVQMPVPGQNVLPGYGQGATFTPQPMAQPMPGMDPSAMYQQQAMGTTGGLPVPGTPEFQQLTAEQQNAIFMQMHQQMLMQQSQMWYFMQQQQQQLQQFAMIQPQPQSLPQAPVQAEIESMEVEPEKGPGKASYDKNIEAAIQQASTETAGLNLNLTEDNPENPDAGNTPDKDFDSETLPSGEESFIILSREGSVMGDFNPGLGDTGGMRRHSPLETTTQAVAMDTSELETQTNQTSQDEVIVVASGSQQGSGEPHQPTGESPQVSSAEAYAKDEKLMNTADTHGTQPDMRDKDASEKAATALHSTCPGTHDAAMDTNEPEAQPEQISLDRAVGDLGSQQGSGEPHRPTEESSQVSSADANAKDKVMPKAGLQPEMGGGDVPEKDAAAAHSTCSVSPEIHNAAMDTIEPERQPDQASLGRAGVDSASRQESGEAHSPPEGSLPLPPTTIATKEYEECKVTAAEDTGDQVAKENDHAIQQAVNMVSPGAAAADKKEDLPGRHDHAKGMDTSNTGDTGAGDPNESMPPIVKPNGKQLLQDYDEKDSPDKKRKRLEEDDTATEQMSSGATTSSAASDKKSTKAKLDTEGQTAQASSGAGTACTEEKSPDHKLTGADGKPTAENSSDRDGKTQSGDCADDETAQTSSGGDVASNEEMPPVEKSPNADGIPTMENTSEGDGTTQTSDNTGERDSVQLIPVDNMDDKNAEPGSSVDAVYDPLTAEARKQKALTKETLAFSQTGGLVKSIQEQGNQEGGDPGGVGDTSDPLIRPSGDGQAESLVFGGARPRSGSYSEAMAKGHGDLPDQGSEASGVRTQ